MNQYPNYNYYGQPMYPQGPINMPPAGYPPFYAPPHPSQQIPPGPVPMSFDAEAYSHHPSSSTPKRKGRRPTSIPASSAAAPQPLKSALKKSSTITATPITSTMEFPQPAIYSNGYPMSRNRSNSFNQSNGEMRRRTYSNAAYSQNDHNGIDPPFQPLHMFVSFQGYNELRLENITELALRELREKIWPIWSDGIESQPVSSNDCVVKFRNQPWDMAGPNYLVALRLIQELFTLCTRRGYVFQTSINTGTAVPRLVFQVVSPDPHSHFFLAFFSSNMRRFTLVNPPSHIDLSLGAQLKAALPRKITTDHVEQDNLRIIEVKRKPNFSASEVEPGLFLAHVLKILNTLGFELDASIPLARKQSIGPRSVQEVLVFKGTLPQG